MAYLAGEVVRPVVGAGCRWLEKTLTAEEERRRRKSATGRRKRGKRGERNIKWLLVVGWWLRWLPVVEMMVGRPVMRVVVAEGDGGERRKKKKLLKWGEKDGFWPTLDPILLSFRP